MYWAYIALPSPTYSSYTRISLKTYHNISVSLSVTGNDSPPVDKSNFLLIKYTSYLFPLIKQFFLVIFPSLCFPSPRPLTQQCKLGSKRREKASFRPNNRPCPYTLHAIYVLLYSCHPYSSNDHFLHGAIADHIYHIV